MAAFHRWDDQHHEPAPMSNIRHLRMRFAICVSALLLCATCAHAESDSSRLKAIAPAKAASTLPPRWSANYPSRIRAAIVPYIAWAEGDVPGNPVAEVEIQTSPDGTIVQTKLLQSSGVESWDQAVRTALAKVGRIPLDTNGQVPRVLVMSFRPKQS